MKHISVAETKVLLDEGETMVLLDCREPWEVEVASILGAVNVPMAEIPGRLHELDTAVETIVICHHGIRSQSVTAFLEEQGFLDVSNMVGGIDAWSREIDAEVPRY